MAEVKEAELKSKTWHGIQLFQLRGNPEWERLINSGSLERIVKKSESFIRTIQRIEERTGEKVLDTEIVQARLAELRQAMLDSAAKEGVPASEVLQPFEAFMVTAKALEFFEDNAVRLDDPSGVTDIRAMRKVADAEDRRARHGEGGDNHDEDKSEEFSLSDLGFAILGENIPRVLFEDVQKERDAEEEATNLRRRANDRMERTEILDDHLVDFVRTYRSVLDKHEGASPKPSDHLKGWKTTDTKRSLRAVVGLVPATNPLVIDPFESILITPNQPEEREAP